MFAWAWSEPALPPTDGDNKGSNPLRDAKLFQ